MISRTILLVDYENVGDAGLEKLPPHQRLLLFVGQGQKPKEDFVTASMNKGIRLDMIPVTGVSKNNLDFHLTFYLGRLVEEDPGSNFIIFSKDKGFNALARHIVKLGLNCTTAKPPEKAVTKNPSPNLDELSKQAIAFLEEGGQEKLPATRTELLDYLIKKLPIDRAFAGQLISRLSSGGATKMNKGQITYNLKRAP